MIGTAEQESAHRFLLSLHAVRFPYAHAATAQFPDEPFYRDTLGLPVGVDLPTLEADMLVPARSARAKARILLKQYFPVGRYLATNNYAVTGPIIEDFLHSAAEVTDLHVAIGVDTDAVDFSSFVPEHNVLTSMHHIGPRRSCQLLVDYVLQQETLVAEETVNAA